MLHVVKRLDSGKCCSLSVYRRRVNRGTKIRTHVCVRFEIQQQQIESR